MQCLVCSAGSRRTKPLLSKYNIANEINNGPSTLVYIAVGRRDKQEYALRITYRHHTDTLHDRRVDTRNIYKIDPRTLSHPNILEYLEIFETADIFATVSTYCPGGSLEDFVLEPSNNYTNANITGYLLRLSSIFRQVTEAIVYLHKQDLIHGNLKLSNIFLRDHKRTIAVVGDLGRLRRPSPDPAQRKIGNYAGTCIFVAPEVMCGSPPSFKSDVYAIGACAYVAVDSTGPFADAVVATDDAWGGDGNTYLALLENSIGMSPDRPLLELRDPSISVVVRDFMDAAAHPDPAKRACAVALLEKQWLSSSEYVPSMQSGVDVVDADDATRLFVTSDEGRDLDFELGKVTAATLMRRHPLRIIGCVAGLHPANMRARLIKGTLIELGLESIPVAVGESKVQDGSLTAGAHEFEVPYLASAAQLYELSGAELCKETLSRSPDKTVTFVLQSGPTDVWKCLEMFPDLFMRKVSRVILRSDVRVEGPNLKLSEDGRILPDVSSASRLDRNHMCELFGLLQDLGIPMTVVTRWASYAAKLPFKIYKDLGNTEHPVAQRLMNQSKQSIEFLWERCLLPPDDPKRKGLPDRCNKEWFCKVFLSGRGLDRRENDSIWDLCEGFSSFSPLQMIASVPELKKHFFKPTLVQVKSKRGGSVTHEVLGVREDDHGVIDPAELSLYITGALLTGFTGTDTVQQHLLIMSDDGKDLDDELAKLLLKSLDERNLAVCKGFIASLHPALMRARLSKGTLNLLGLGHIQVGVGASMGTPACNDYEFDVDYMAEPDEVLPNGVELFVRQLELAEDGLFTLVVLCGMRDAWDLLRQHTELFRRKISRVVIMGGVEVTKENEPVMSDEGFMIPDTAANNAFDPEAARFFYRELQRQSIPMTIVSRWAAYAAKLPLSLYDRMAKTGHPVGVRLQKAQKSSLQHLWKRANMSAADPAREGLPPRCNKEWFSSVFLGNQGLERNGDDSVWDLATTFQPYDCIALLGALPGIRDRYLNPHVFTIQGINGPAVHEVMGLSAQMNGVRDGVALRSWLEGAMMKGVELTKMSKAPSTKPVSPKISHPTRSFSEEVHHVRAFAQKYAHQTPKMKSGRMLVLKNLLSFCSEEGLL